MATHSCILDWRIPWIEEPGGIQPLESQRVGHYFMTNVIILHSQQMALGIYKINILGTVTFQWPFPPSYYPPKLLL